MDNLTVPAESTLPAMVSRAHESGLRVVPQYYKQGRKKPLIRWKEYQERRPSKDELEKIHHKWPGAMWCFIAGEPSGLIVLDFDGPAGRETLRRLKLRPAVVTPSGGAHVYVKWPGYKVKIIGQGIEGFPGMELLGENHLVTFYGTNKVGTYRKSPKAKVYRLEELPADLRALIESARVSEKELHPVPLPTGFSDFAPAEQILTEALATVEMGGAREQTGFWLAGQLRDERVPFDRVVAQVVGQYQPSVEGKGSHPYTKQEAYHSVVSAFTLSPRAPRSLGKDTTVGARLDWLRKDDQARELLRQEKAAASFSWPPYRRDLREELAIEEPPLPFTIAQLQPTGTNVQLLGKYKVGKTTLVMNLWRSLLDHVPFLSAYDVSSPVGKVGYWNGELTESQFRSWCRDLNIRNLDQGIVLHTRGRRLDISASVVEEQAVRWLGENEVEFWIVDPLARFYFGEENSNSEIGRWLESLDVIKQRSGVKDLLLVTHRGRGDQAEGEEHARGASRLDDWADVRWTYVREAGDRFFGAEGRDVSLPQVKLGYRASDRALSIAGGGRAEERKNRYMVRVLRIVAGENDSGKRPGYGELESQLKGPGMDTNAIKPTINEAVMNGYLLVEEKGNKHEHLLTDAGREFLRLHRHEEETGQFIVTGPT